MRKPNLQSPLDRLTDDQQHKIFELLKDKTYEDALPIVRKEYGVRTSIQSLSRFIKRRAGLEMMRDALAATDAFESSEELKMLAPRVRKTAVAGFFQAVTAGEPKTALEFGKFLLSLNADEREEKHLALMREKFEAAEKRENGAKAALNDNKLTPEQREAKLKEIFGI